MCSSFFDMEFFIDGCFVMYVDCDFFVNVNMRVQQVDDLAH